MLKHSFIHKLEAILLVFALCVTSILYPENASCFSLRKGETVLFNKKAAVIASSKFVCIILSSYEKTMDIGQSFYLVGISSNGKSISWKSSNVGVASVNTYGQVTAKKAGNCKITARVRGAEASCRIVVKKTFIYMNTASVAIENGAVYRMCASTSDATKITWKSSKKSVAIIDDDGRIEAQKPGETTITASAGGSRKTCRLTVKKPAITLNAEKISLYRTQTFRLNAKVSSGRTPSFSSRKKSVADIDDNGIITAYKHGTANVQVKLDGVTKVCEVTVLSPKIKLTPAKASLKPKQTLKLKVSVSSGNPPVFSSSKKTVATVDSHGVVRAVGKGTCTICAEEDGTKEYCKITV